MFRQTQHLKMAILARFDRFVERNSYARIEPHLKIRCLT
jgi:hypothetical protein